jgi:hypothetical protein
MPFGNVMFHSVLFKFPIFQLLKVLTNHEVKEKEIHNFKVSVKVLEELTPQEIRELRCVFETFDGNSDGYV